MSRFDRMKTFVRDHKFGVGVGAGIALGVAVLLITKNPNQPGLVNNVMVTPEDLQHLITNPEAVVSFNISPNHFIWVTNASSKENL